jgi:Molybdenum cofactor biosynthesis enzyme
VLMRDLNDDEAVPLLRYCLDHGYELRFIEQMPLDAHHAWKPAARWSRPRTSSTAVGRPTR